MTRIDACMACHRPFHVDIICADPSEPEKIVDLVCPHCNEIFPERSNGILFTSKLLAEAEEKWSRSSLAAADNFVFAVSNFLNWRESHWA